MIKINGVVLPTPSDLNIGLMDIDKKSGRNAAGFMMRNRIRTVRKLELSWNYLKKEDLSKTLKMVSPTFFQVDYIDPQENSWKNGTFYCGDRHVGALDYRNGNIRYKDVKFNLIER